MRNKLWIVPALLLTVACNQERTRTNFDGVGSTTPAAESTDDTPANPTATGPTRPSAGTGGTPGLSTRTVTTSGVPFDYLVYAPPSLDPQVAAPTLWVFHAQSGSAAETLDMWRAEADKQQFIVAALSGSGANNQWNISRDTLSLQHAVLDLEAAFNIETLRRYLWGYRAGASFVHVVGLRNSDQFTAYATSSGCIPSPEVASRLIPVSMTIGTNDPLLPKAESDKMRLEAAGHPVNLRTFNGGTETRANCRAASYRDLSAHTLPTSSNAFPIRLNIG